MPLPFKTLEGVDLKGYSFNPIVTMNHDFTRTPIGKLIDIKCEGEKVFGQMILVDSEDAKMAAKMLEDGTAVLAPGYIEKNGTIEILEMSVVLRPEKK